MDKKEIFTTICTAKQCASTSWWSIGTSMKVRFAQIVFPRNAILCQKIIARKKKISCQLHKKRQTNAFGQKNWIKKIQFKGKQLDGTAQTCNKHASQLNRDLFNNKVYLIIVYSANTLIHTINAICILIRREQFSLRNQTNVRGKTSVTKTLCKIK